MWAVLLFLTNLLHLQALLLSTPQPHYVDRSQRYMRENELMPAQFLQLAFPQPPMSLNTIPVPAVGLSWPNNLF